MPQLNIPLDATHDVWDRVISQAFRQSGTPTSPELFDEYVFLLRGGLQHAAMIDVFVPSVRDFKQMRKLSEPLMRAKRTPAVKAKYGHSILIEAKLFQYRKALIPVHQDKRFVIVAIYTRDSCIEYYNSSAGLGADQIGQTMALEVRNWLHALLDDEHVLSKWPFGPVARDKTIQHSTLLRDSGPVSMITLRYLTFDVEIPSQKNLKPLELEERATGFRNRIEMELMAQKLNPYEEIKRIMEVFGNMNLGDGEGEQTEGSSGGVGTSSQVTTSVAGTVETLTKSSAVAQGRCEGLPKTATGATSRTIQVSSGSTVKEYPGMAPVSASEKVGRAGKHDDADEQDTSGKQTANSFRTTDLGEGRLNMPTKLLELLEQKTTTDE